MKLTDRQAFALITTFLLGNVLSGIGGTGTGPKTGYLSVWISLGILVLLSLLVQQVVRKNPNRDFFQLTKHLLGKTGNKIFLVFLIIYSFAASFLSITNYMDFIRFSSASGFPVTVGLVSILLLTAYFCVHGIKTMGRYAQMVLPVVIGSVGLLLVLGVGEIREIHLPLPTSVSQFINQGWQIYCSPFSEIIFVWILFGYLQNPGNIGKISIKAATVTASLFSLVYLFHVNLLGENVLQQTRFPTYFSASLIEVGILVENAESLITLSYSFCDILYGALCLLVLVKAVEQLQKKPVGSACKTKKITAISAVIFMLILYSFGKIQEYLPAYYPVISVFFLPLTTGLPILLFLLTTGKNIHEKHSASR